MTARACLHPLGESKTVTPEPRALGLYLHIPFCLQKCPYCSFFSRPVNQDMMDRYILALHVQIRRLSDPKWTSGRAATTIFFGGGTPSVLPAATLADLLRACREEYVSDARNLECSIEVNPATVEEADLQELVSAGFNRLSVGVQSFSDQELACLGRPHSAADARAVIHGAHRAGFGNINLDLMYGLPGQTVSDWQQTLQSALLHEPEHLSIYELTVEEGTRFGALHSQGKLDLPAENEVLEMMNVTAEETARAGLRRYEISNYARPGRECRHNINYWHNGSYIGLGPAAVSSLSGRRYPAIEDIGAYCSIIESGRDSWLDAEILDKEARFRETVIMGLRLTAGISLSSLERRFGFNVEIYYGRKLRMLEQQGLLVIEDDTLRLTSSGLKLANQVMAELV